MRIKDRKVEKQELSSMKNEKNLSKKLVHLKSQKRWKTMIL